VKQDKVNIDALHHPEKYDIAREGDLLYVPNKDAAVESQLKIYYVKDNKKHELPESEYGYFYDGESYIVHFGIRLRSGGSSNIVYHWQGRRSAVEDKGSAALLATNLAHSLGRATQVRVVQNKEPDHCLAHFEGYMCIRRGKRDAPPQKPRKELYQLRGTKSVNTRAIAVDPVAPSLNSNDAFILDTDDVAYVWYGKGANEFEKNMAKVMVKRIIGDSAKSIKELQEGSEPAEFWQVLGGKSAYSDQDFLVEKDISARLFQCSDATGSFKVFEIHNFTQDDLDDDDVMLLDAYHSVFVWIGRGSTENEKQQSNQTAVDYIKQADDGRSVDSPIYIIQAGSEPPLFTVYFRGWDYGAAGESNDPYLKKLKAVSQQLDLTDVLKDAQNEEEKQALQRAQQRRQEREQAQKQEQTLIVLDKTAVTPAQEEKTSVGEQKTYDYSFLRRGARDARTPYPEGVDSQQLEAYLSQKQFDELFHVSKEEFYKFPRWKQLRIKKELGLF